jgi:putative glycerol-1-phosphate prenyltransferase
MINAVRKAVDVPLIVGGGLDTPQKAQNALQAGADILVIGNALEKDPDLLIGISEKVYDWNQAMRN